MITQIELTPELKSRRKKPRLFLKPSPSEHTMDGVELIWLERLDREFSRIYDLSLSGVSVKASNILSGFKKNQEVSARLKWAPQNFSVDLKLRVQDLSASRVSFAMDSISASGRLTIDQHTRDQMISAFMQKHESCALSTTVNASVWWSGPFDTNFAISEDQNIFWIEYDGLLLTFDQSTGVLQTRIKKSVSANEEARGYFYHWFESNTEKISVGASWIDRALKLLHSRVDLSVSLEPIILKLAHLKTS